MPTTDSPLQDIVTVSRLVRRCFQRMRAIGDALHADLGINSSLRALLEWLSEHNKQTVPRVAEAKSVSRQHVQKVADELADLGLVEFRANPGHKRSPFIALTAKGANRFALMRARETELFAELAGAFTAKEAKSARAFLEKFDSRLKAIQGKFEDDNE